MIGLVQFLTPRSTWQPRSNDRTSRQISREVSGKAEQTLTCNDVGALLRIGTNRLYIEAESLESATGLLFSATIKTTDEGTIFIRAYEKLRRQNARLWRVLSSL